MASEGFLFDLPGKESWQSGRQKYHDPLKFIMNHTREASDWGQTTEPKRLEASTSG